MNMTQKLPSLRSLRGFQVAGKHLSFKLAADELYVTPSAVSHQVKHLESFLGLDLFIRKTRALEFTEPGRKYFDFLDGMFSRLEMETHQLWAQYGRGMIRLCVPPFFANEILLPKLHDFQAIMPDTDIRVSTQHSLVKEHSSETDLSILLGSGDWPELVTYRLFARRLVVAGAPGLLKDFDRSSFKSLNGQTLIVHENRPHAWSNWAKALDIEVPVAGKVLRFDSMSTVVQAAAQGLGFAIVSWPLSKNWFVSGALQRVFETEWITDEHFYLAHRPEESERLDIVNLINWIIREFQTDA
ncbi:MAG TPA: LysR substrate-binding domain-containing protein [Xanthomonadales bacterium]